MCHILINNLVSCFMDGCLSCHLEFITERKSPFYTRSVTRLKGRINWFFFSSCTKKMKEVAVVTLDEGVRGMCGEINPFRIGEQFLFQQPLCFGSHHTHISRATSCFLRLLQSYSCPFIAPKPETWLFFHFRVWLYPISRCCWYLTLEVCIKSSQRGSEASMLMEKFNYDNVSLCLDKDDL